MKTDRNIHSDLPIPPGEYLEEVLEELGMTKADLASRMDRPAPKLSAIFKGEKAITPDTALQLEKVVGIPAHIWTGLEAEYRLAQARLKHTTELKRLRAEVHLVTKFQYSDLVRFGVIEKLSRPMDKVLALQKFFGVTSLKNISKIKRYQAAFRKGKKAASSDKPEAVAAWLRMGELSAIKIPCQPFNKSKLKVSLEDIRRMSRQQPEEFQSSLYDLLRSLGVALVLCPHMPGSGIHGATFWMRPDKAVLMMTIRYKWADIFWFSLFHELGHIMLHGRNTVVLEGIDGAEELEDEADVFAANSLIPPSDYRSFCAAERYYLMDIQDFAKEQDIDPGIVVGRLQNDGLIEHSWHNKLRTRFEWKLGLTGDSPGRQRETTPSV